MSSPNFGLALPKPSKPKNSAGSSSNAPGGPVFGRPMHPPIGKKRRRKALLAASNDYDRDLDEGDDVDEKEWKRSEGGVNKKRKVDDDYDGEGGEGEGEEQGEGEEGEGEDDRRGSRGVEGEEGDGDGEDGEVEGGEYDDEGGGEGEGEGDETGAHGRGRKKAHNTELDDEALQKKHRKAEGERLALRSLLDDEQGRRYDAFKVAVIPRPAIKRLNLQIYDQRVNDSLTFLLAGMAKIFVADMIELAKDLQANSAHPTGPLRPYHLRLARSMMEERGVLSGADQTSGGQGRARKPLFRR